MAGEAEHLIQSSRQYFQAGTTVRIFRAPGRVNLIGEHTDYNEGFVLPIALDMACFVAAAHSGEDTLRVYSSNMQEARAWPISAIASLQADGHWSDYVLGVAQQLIRIGVEIEGMNLAVYSTVPVGSGLSSSASIEVASALALLHGRPLGRRELAQLTQRAEREFVGVPVGIMDQYVSVFGEPHKAIRIDCRSITHQGIPLPENVAIIAVNSMVKHQLGDSAYKTRVRECAEAVLALQARYGHIRTLRDVTVGQLTEAAGQMSETVFRRARHVISENERVELFSEAAQAGDLQKMGDLFLASHRSMQHDYEISCDEIDYLVEVASGISGVYGSRMTGGGFGGCTVNLVAEERVPYFYEVIIESYKKRFGIHPELFVCVPAEGAGEITK